MSEKLVVKMDYRYTEIYLDVESMHCEQGFFADELKEITVKSCLVYALAEILTTLNLECYE